ncbi:MAG: hypothetical protein VX181_18895, partial [Pseudomonadota bacterium]|nr:hypothetical protein [Pseudomonadota bacterium]
MTLMKSWVASANSADSQFPLNNLPYGVFSTGEEEPRCGVAIGDMILDLAAAEEAGLVELAEDPVLDVPFWNEVMELGPEAWAALRTRLMQLLGENSAEKAAVEPLLLADQQAPLLQRTPEHAAETPGGGRASAGRLLSQAGLRTM